MKYQLAIAGLLMAPAAHAQIVRVKLTQPLPYYKSLRDTTSFPPIKQRYLAGTEIQIWQSVNARWYAVSVVTEHDVAAWYVRSSALRKDLLRGGLTRLN